VLLLLCVCFGVGLVLVLVCLVGIISKQAKRGCRRGGDEGGEGGRFLELSVYNW